MTQTCRRCGDTASDGRRKTVRERPHGGHSRPSRPGPHARPVTQQPDAGGIAPVAAPGRKP